MFRSMNVQGISASCHFRVEFEEVGDDFGFGRIGREAVGGKHGADVRLVRRAQVGRHRNFVIQICKRAIGMLRAGVKNGLRGLGYFLTQRRRGR